MKIRALPIIVVLVCASWPARAETPRAGLLAGYLRGMAMGTLGSLSVTPGTISFQATNPGLGQVSGSSSGNVTWIVSAGSHLQNWTVTVQAASSTFVDCPTIPVSAVRVTCTTASASGGGGTASCSGPSALSPTPQQVASGLQGDGTNSYSVSINFSLAESWRYVAKSSCTLSLTYSVSAP